MPPPRSDEEAFAVVDRGYVTPCRVWTGGLTAKGYARRRDSDGRMRMLHVIEWEKVNGPVPEGLQLDHLCCQRDCAEVSHLEPVTAAENSRRRTRRITHCPRGHAYDAVNTYLHRGRRRICRACRRETMRRLRAAGVVA